MKRFLIFGAILGEILGLICFSLDILIWDYMGRPPVLIRQDWEDIHLIFLIILGLFAGLLYGSILSLIISLKALKEKAALIFIFTILVAVVFYTIADIISIKYLNIWAYYCVHGAVFIISLVIARIFSRPLLNKAGCINSKIIHLDE